MKAYWRILLPALALLLIGQDARAADRVRVGKAAATAATMVPLAVGVSEGLFERRGLELQVFDFAGGPMLHQAMAAGSLDLGIGAGTDLALVAKGAPELAVCNGAGPLIFLGVVVPAESTARSLDDVKGARFGVTATTSLTYWLALELARQRGWGEGGITPVALGGATSSILTAFRAHLVDAGIAFTALAFEMEAEHEGRLLAPASAFAGNLGGSTIFATRAFIAANPDAIRRFLLGWFDAVRFMRAPGNREEAIRIAAHMTGMAPDIEAREFDLTLPMFNLDGRFDPETLANLKRSFVELKLIDHEPDMSKLYTEKFLPQS